MTLRVNAAAVRLHSARASRTGLAHCTPVRRIQNADAEGSRPAATTCCASSTTRPASTAARPLQALKGTGIAVPPLRDYAWRLWDYWERHLDPDLFIDRSLSGAVQGKVVLVTGGSAGIGKAAAHKIAEAGAMTLICRPRRGEAGRRPSSEIAGSTGGYAPASTLRRWTSPTWPAATRFDAAGCWRDHGGVDFLINNAGRSIRRAIENSLRPLPRLRAHDAAQLLRRACG
ncbi:MAG: SDR family NAD(P)-dependent oxidoreductase [Comamonadaceae bacterium]|nr:SDR family NAD(P)-dependent oxidoreductase [Comamonadaceae bacterium]